MFLDTKQEHEAQFFLFLLHQHHALSITSFGNPCPHRSVSQLLYQILGQLILTAQPLLHANMSKCEFFLPLMCHLHSSLYEEIKVCVSVGFAHFPADTSPSFPPLTEVPRAHPCNVPFMLPESKSGVLEG